MGERGGEGNTGDLNHINTEKDHHWGTRRERKRKETWLRET